MDRYIAAGALAILIASIGCNQSSQSGQSIGDQSVSATAPEAPSNSNASAPQSSLGATPENAVGQFLEAVRIGNDETASLLLTPKARQKTAEAHLAVAPPGSPTATFSVGKVEFISSSKDAAHVLSTWTDVGEDGTKNSDEIIWALRKETEGWRIAGSLMRLKQFPNKPPLVLDYEDPEDMKRTMQKFYAEEEAAQNQQTEPNTAQPQAKAPDSNPAAIR
ncbi:MAG: hypothetical protein IT427_08235 [Pirellulales bacterium]|nr:hypothetical protein [Pirellulales bacterium]